MASDNARHFELRLRKLGLFLLICSMAGLLFASFLFGVFVGNDLETYTEKISRQLPVKILEWAGLLEAEKAPPAVVIKSEKGAAKEETVVPGLIAQGVIPSPLPLPLPEGDSVRGESPSPVQEKETMLPPPPMSDKAKAVEESLVTAKDKEPATDKYIVQVTSCKSRKIAEDVVKKIGKVGYHAKIVTAEIKDKGTWYRVLLSDFDSKHKANEAAGKIDRVLTENKSVVRIQNR